MNGRIRSFWEHFPHAADIGIRGLGPTRNAAFEQAAVALTAAVCDPATVQERTCVPIHTSGESDDFLFLNWIDALVYEMATRRMLFRRCAVQISGKQLSAECWGEPIEVARHQPAAEIKGATFTELKVTRTAHGWLAQCVVDV